jgi:hypothetical protein
MPNIDIPIPEDVKRALEMPKCLDLKLPEPEELTITLPTGGALKAINDISKGIPNDCSLTLSLMVQIAPLLASMECLLKILKLLKPLIDVIKGLPFPPVKAVQDFIEAAKDIVPCFLLVTPAGICPLVRDILKLIIKILGCLIQQMKSLIGLMTGISISLQLAQADGNSELIATLECAQDNAAISAQHLIQAFAPVAAILDLMAPLLEIAGQSAITIPTMPPGTDPEALNHTVGVFEGIRDALQIVVDALPC